MISSAFSSSSIFLLITVFSMSIIGVNMSSVLTLDLIGFEKSCCFISLPLRFIGILRGFGLSTACLVDILLDHFFILNEDFFHVDRYLHCSLNIHRYLPFFHSLNKDRLRLVIGLLHHCFQLWKDLFGILYF